MIDSVSPFLDPETSIPDDLKERAILLHISVTGVCQSFTHSPLLNASFVHVIYAMRKAWKSIYCAEPLK